MEDDMFTENPEVYASMKKALMLPARALNW